MKKNCLRITIFLLVFASLQIGGAFQFKADAAWVYTLSYDDNGGKGVMQDRQAQSGKTFNLDENKFTKTGYTFAGWSETAGGPKKYDNKAAYTMPESNVTLYAVWTPNTYTLHYNANGGSGAMPDKSAPTGTAFNLANNSFTRAGYTFAGWSERAEGPKRFNNGELYTMPASDVTLYAVWTPNIYTLSFNANNTDSGSSGSMSEIRSEIGSEFPLMKNLFVRPGYRFAGWGIAAAGPVVYEENAAFTMPGNDITLYAQWTRLYTLSYSANGGSGTMADKALAPGDYYILNANTFTRTGYVFEGWGTTPGGPVVYRNLDNFTMPGNDITLYARWKGNTYVLSYHANGGSGSMAGRTAFTGEEVALALSTFTSPKDGYSFGGWSTTPTGEALYAGGASFTMPGADTILYAQWRPDTCTLNYDANGGSGTMAASTAATDQVFNLTPNAFTFSGYAFVGWSTIPGGSVAYADKASYTMPAGGGTLYAVWERTYTLSYHANGGSGTMAAVTAVAGQSFPLASNAFTLSGYGFVGWSTSLNGPLAYADGASYTMPAGGGTVYAVWEVKPGAGAIDISKRSVGITKGGEYLVTGTTTTNYIAVNTTEPVTITLDNVRIRHNTQYPLIGSAPIHCNADVTLYIKGQNILQGGPYAAGIKLNKGDKLVIDKAPGYAGTPELSAYGNDLAAGIGGNKDNTSAGSITIRGGSVNAYGGSSAAGIGGGATQYDLNGGKGGEVTISGGTVYSQGGESCDKYTTSEYIGPAGIGGGLDGDGGTVIISGGTVTAKGGVSSKTYPNANDPGAGIGGGGARGKGGSVIITGGSVKAAVGGIGGGKDYRNTGTITNGRQNISLVVIANAVASDGNTEVTRSLMLKGINSGNNEQYSYTYSYTGKGHGSGDTSLYFYLPPRVTLKYNANGGSGTMADTLANWGIVVSLTPNAFTRTGYTFAGWSTAADGTVEYANGASYTMPQENLTLYAKWTANSYTLSYNANGGSGTMADKIAYTDQVFNLAANTFTRTGYTFAGWSTSANGAVAYADKASYTMPGVNTTLYAKWTGNPHTLRYNANGGAGTMADKATNTCQQFYLASNTFTRAGYSFAGWNTTPATGYVQYVNGAFYTMPDADVILYASWNAGNFTLSYNANGGSGTAPAGERMVMGDTFTAANNPFTPPANKKFKEWNTAADGSGTVYAPGTTAAVPPQNLTLYAIWCDYTPAERIDADLDALVWDAIKSGNSTENDVKAALNLPKTGVNGTSIAWSASPTGIINTDTGAVTRQLVDKAVALTATVSYTGGTEKPKTFNLTVPAIPGKFEAEDAVIYKAKVFGDAQAVGASGGKQVGNINTEGSSSVLWDNLPMSRTVEIRYASPNSGTISIYQNGVHVRDAAFAATGGWYGTGHFSSLWFPMEINSGDSLKIQYDNGDAVLNLDYLECYASPITSAVISPVSGTFDKAEPANVTATVTLNDAVSISDIKAGTTSIGTGSYSVTAIDGATATLAINKEYLAAKAPGNLVLTVVFAKGAPATLTIAINDAVPDTPVSIAAITGVTAPVCGAAPAAVIIETAQYTGTVTWNPAHNPFAASTVYTATIILTPKAGYTLNGVAENFFTVVGATATHAANSGIITAEFPVTGAEPAVTYSVTYDANGGTGTAPIESVKTAGATFAAANNTFTPPGGKKFKYWYTNPLGTGGTAYAKDTPDATVTMPAHDLILYAVWEDESTAVKRGYLEVKTLAGGAVKLNGKSAPLSTVYSKPCEMGESIRLEAEANPGYIFAYWLNVESSSVISTSPDYEIIMGSGINLIAVFSKAPAAGDTCYAVTFKDKNGRILQSTNVAKNGSVTPPIAPPLFGYSFSHWSHSSGSVTSNMVITAVYVRKADTHTVTVAGGTLSTGGNNGSYRFDMPVTVVADTAPDGQKFSHWEQDGKKVSTKSVFTFFTPMENTTLVAVFVDNGGEIENKPFITLSDDVMVNSTNGTIMFTAIKDLPADCTLVESGVLLLKSSTSVTDLEEDTPNVIFGKILDTSTDQFFIMKSDVGAGDTWYGRAYLIYKDGGGDTVTVYSDNIEHGTR
jgi:uncharacterized repeat protein (TIGR02543 family)